MWLNEKPLENKKILIKIGDDYKVINSNDYKDNVPFVYLNYVLGCTKNKEENLIEVNRGSKHFLGGHNPCYFSYNMQNLKELDIAELNSILDTCKDMFKIIYGLLAEKEKENGI